MQLLRSHRSHSNCSRNSASCCLPTVVEWVSAYPIRDLWSIRETLPLAYSIHSRGCRTEFTTPTDRCDAQLLAIRVAVSP